MADKYDEKSSVQEYETHNEPVGGVKEVTAASVALAAAVAARKPSLLSPGMLKLYFILSVGYLISTMNGFDSSLMVGWYRSSFLERGHWLLQGAINAMETYQKSFGLSGAGSSTGIIFIIYNLGQIAAFPFCSFLADGYGRRKCIFIGCLIVILGTAVQTSSHTRSAFMGGRFILGFGAAIASVW
jgi:MFS family permease